MKKIFAAVMVAMMSLTASAENWFVGGEVGLWRNDSDHETFFKIMPEAGYSFNETWTVGASVGYSMDHFTGVTGNLFKVAPYARYTYFRLDRISLFVDGGVDLGLGWTSYKHGNDSDTACTYGIGFKPGFAVNVTDKFSLVAHFGFLGYQGANDAAKDGGADTAWGLDFSGYNLTFGFYYNF
ncbi:MAG: porin family protein [Bacteroidales bacterium]|nr:porin family protein [Bacteroidales bacterium]